MNEKSEFQKRRYPADRLKLRERLEKKEQELQELQAEVEYLRSRVKQADAVAINATVAMYNITPEQLAEAMEKLYGDRSKPVPELPSGIKGAQEQIELTGLDPFTSDEEDDIDDETTL